MQATLQSEQQHHQQVEDTPTRRNEVNNEDQSLLGVLNQISNIMKTV